MNIIKGTPIKTIIIIMVVMAMEMVTPVEAKRLAH